LVDAGKFAATTDFSRIREVEAVIICVPTPLNKNREPNLSYVLETGRAIAPYLKSLKADLEIEDGRSEMGDGRSKASPSSELPTSNFQRRKLIVLESTTYPGTTEEELRAVLEENSPFVENTEWSGGSSDIEGKVARVSDEGAWAATEFQTLKAAAFAKPTASQGKAEREGAKSKIEDRKSKMEPNAKRRMRAGVDFHLAFSPEREDPGNDQSKVKSIPKVVGGYTPACLERAVALYSRAIDTIVPVSSCRVAEATKLLENIFRSVNIALVNELKLVYEAMGIDIWEVITAAKTKPFGFMPFYPGPGLGGHCIPIDPFYLTWKARECGQHTRFIELAGEINTKMPQHVVHRVADALNARQKPISGSKILILGLAYKPNVDDERESPSYVLMKLLTERGAEVQYHDPYVPVIKPTREHPQFAGKKSVGWNQTIIESFNLVLIATNHSCVNYQELGEWAQCIVDTRNAMAPVKGASGKVWKA
jgi:UDP-N-acetyl-D-mannosaminuronate dehydrogenase